MDLVTGGCGFIGSHLVDALLAQGRHVNVIDIQPWKYAPHPNLQVTLTDIRRDFKISGIERVFHLAALADIIPSVENPVDYYETNVTGTLNILEAARKSGCRKFIYAASSSCYGLQGSGHEDDICAPVYPYALTKYMGEQLVMHWAKVYKLPAISLRLFNVYGLRHRTGGTYGAMFGTFLAQMANGKPITLVGDGTQKRDFVHVSDVIRAILMAADSADEGIYNIGSDAPISINEIVKLMGAKKIAFLPERPGEPYITHADITKIKARLGWEPKIKIEDGVKELMDNLHIYKDAPVWEAERINEVTKPWFEALA